MSVIISGTTGIDTIQDNTVTSAKIVNDTITNADLKTGDAYKMVKMTAVTCAGQTSIDFTGIPSWAKIITVSFNNISTSGASIIQIQIGTGGTPTTTGYNSSAREFSTTVFQNNNATTGFILCTDKAATDSQSGVFKLVNLTGNLWVASGNGQDLVYMMIQSGFVTLTGALDMVRLTTVNGIDTFDTTPSAGSINVMYEG